MTNHTTFDSWRMLPEEGAALFGVAGEAGFINRRLRHQLGSFGSMGIVAIGASHLACGDRMGGHAVNLRPLGLVTVEANLALRLLDQRLVVAVPVDLVASRAGNVVTWMLAAFPERSRSPFMAGQTNFGLGLGSGLLGTGKQHVRRIARALQMVGALTVAGLATGRAVVGLDAMAGLIDSQYWFVPRCIVAGGAHLIALQRAVCYRGTVGSLSQGSPGETGDERAQDY